MWLLYILGVLIALFIGACMFLNWLGRAEKFIVAPKTLTREQREKGIWP